MADTVFSSGVIIASTWLNDINNAVYHAIGTGTVAPTTPGQVLANIGAASSGANTNITSLTGLTTALAVAYGGTGGTTTATARSGIGAAASGANSDITSLAAPALGSATATTQTVGDATTKVATTAFVATGLALKSDVASPTFTGLVTTAGQIAFPATQNPSAGANVLDDYEEGTWTPAPGAGWTVVGTPTYVGTYIKVGRVILVSYTLTSTTSLACTSAAPVAGLPFVGTTSMFGSHTFVTSTLATQVGWANPSGALYFPVVTTCTYVYGTAIYLANT